MVSYTRSTNVHVNMYFPNSNFDGNFSTYVFGKSFWHYRELNIHCWTSQHIYCEKILKSFVCVEVRILVEKCNIYEVHSFSRPLLQTCRLETTSLYLNNRLLVNKNFKILITFIEINVNFCLFCAHHVMTSIILHTRNLTVNKKSVTHLVLMFQMIFWVGFWGAEKRVFHIVPFRPTKYVLKSFWCLDVSNDVRNWNKFKNNIYWRSKLQLFQMEIRIFIK